MDFCGIYIRIEILAAKFSEMDRAKGESTISEIKYVYRSMIYFVSGHKSRKNNAVAKFYDRENCERIRYCPVRVLWKDVNVNGVIDRWFRKKKTTR